MNNSLPIRLLNAIRELLKTYESCIVLVAERPPYITEFELRRIELRLCGEMMVLYIRMKSIPDNNDFLPKRFVSELGNILSSSDFKYINICDWIARVEK